VYYLEFGNNPDRAELHLFTKAWGLYTFLSNVNNRFSWGREYDNSFLEELYNNYLFLNCKSYLYLIDAV